MRCTRDRRAGRRRPRARSRAAATARTTSDLSRLPRVWSRSRSCDQRPATRGVRGAGRGSRLVGTAQGRPRARLRAVPPLAAPLLELLERARPVALEQPRERAIREQLSLRLAGCAVVRLVAGVDDPLDGRGAGGTRLAVASVRGHLGPEGRHLLRKAFTRLRAQSLDPDAQHRLRRREQPLALLFLQPGGSASPATDGRRAGSRRSRRCRCPQRDGDR